MLPLVGLHHSTTRPGPTSIPRNHRSDLARNIIADSGMPYLSLGIFLDRTILQPDEQQPLLIERKDQLVIVPGMSGRPGAYDLFVNRAELLPVVTEGFRGDFEGRKTEPSGGAGNKKPAARRSRCVINHRPSTVLP
jgi:hypothetical protein